MSVYNKVSQLYIFIPLPLEPPPPPAPSSVCLVARLCVPQCLGRPGRDPALHSPPGLGGARLLRSVRRARRSGRREVRVRARARGCRPPARAGHRPRGGPPRGLPLHRRDVPPEGPARGERGVGVPGRASARKAAEGPPPEPTGQCVPSLLPRRACGWNPRGALSSRGCAGLTGRAARLSRSQGRRDDRRGALPCGSQEETPPHARAMREACRVGQGTKDSLAPVGRHRGKLRIGWFD